MLLLYLNLRLLQLKIMHILNILVLMLLLGELSLSLLRMFIQAFQLPQVVRFFLQNTLELDILGLVWILNL